MSKRRNYFKKKENKLEKVGFQMDVVKDNQSLSQTKNNGGKDKKWNFGKLFNINPGNKKEKSKQAKKGIMFRKLAKVQKRKLEKSSWIGLLQLGLWDNTCGPRVDCVWTGSEEIPDDVQQYALKITIIADLGKNLENFLSKC